MRVALLPTEPDACASARWLAPTGRVLPFTRHPRPRVSDAATVRLGGSSVSRNRSENSR